MDGVASINLLVASPDLPTLQLMYHALCFSVFRVNSTKISQMGSVATDQSRRKTEMEFRCHEN